MKTNTLVMNFSVDKEKSQIKVERQFAAPLPKVWEAWTDSRLLDQWWAPKPYQARTKTMDFREGGHWLYAMVGPDGTEQWCKTDFKSIKPLKSFSHNDAFCDEKGIVDSSFPSPLWISEFREQENSTFVSIDIKFNNPSDLEKYAELGFKEGFTAALENLDQLLETL